jgi:hypothetical protein
MVEHKKHWYSRWWMIVIYVFIIFAIIGSFLGNSETKYQSGNMGEDKNVNSQTTESLQILEHHQEYGEYGNLIITGTAKNIGNKQLSYAEVRVKFYDKDDSLISNSLDNVNDLDAGETWKFEVVYLGLDTYNVDRYEIAVGSTW